MVDGGGVDDERAALHVHTGIDAATLNGRRKGNADVTIG
jgi:hypothetical protein